MRDGREALSRFGRNLRSARRTAGLSQEVLASRAGISRSYLGRVEAGGSECRFLTAMRLADGLGIGIDELRDGIACTPGPDPTGRERGRD